MKANTSIFYMIQARMTSSRLPGKVMLPICELSILELLFKRLDKVKDQIIIVTTDDGSEEPILNICKQYNIKTYQGSTDNVLQRYYKAAEHYKAEDETIIVRLTSDCPFMDLDLINRIKDFYSKNTYDFVANTFTRTFPKGMDVAVFNFAKLQEAYLNAHSDYEKEHVTPYLRDPQTSKTYSYEDKEDNSQYRVTLDTPEDYEQIQALYKALDCNINCNYETLLSLLKEGV